MDADFEAKHPRNPDGTFRVKAGELLSALVGGGRFDAFNTRLGVWRPLAEVRRSDRYPRKIDMREFGVSGRGPDLTVHGFFVEDEQMVRLRERADWADQLSTRLRT